MRQFVQLSVRVDGKPLHQYRDQDDDFFVEGRKGSEYTLHINNSVNERVLVVLSVDGLSIMDGEQATPDSRGYILGPYGSMEIPGWSLGDKSVAKFKFGAKDSSYAALGETQDTSNVGTLGMLVYSEKTKPVPFILNQYLNNGTYEDDVRPRGPYWSKSPQYGSNVSNSNGLEGYSPLRGVSAVNNMSVGQGAGVTQTVGALALQQSSIASPVQAQAAVANLGTQFGDESQFKTRSVSFERGTLMQTTVVYYDDAKGLKFRGIQVIRNPRTPAPKGNPFPGTGCKPPANWRG